MQHIWTHRKKLTIYWKQMPITYSTLNVQNRDFTIVGVFALFYKPNMVRISIEKSKLSCFLWKILLPHCGLIPKL